MKVGRPSRTDLYRRLHTQIAELWARMGGLPSPLEAADIWQGIWFEEAHNSTAIEGNTLVLRQVEVLLAEGRAVGNKQLREYMEVTGYAAAADWIYDQAIRRGGAEPPRTRGGAELLNITEVRRIHEACMAPVWEVAPHADAGSDESPGSFRHHDIRPFPGGMSPPPWPEVPSLLSTWIASANDLESMDLDMPEAIGELHCRFEQIHPFLDGNGRTGRLVLNLLLIRLGYPPAIIYKRQRDAYLRALRRGDKGDFGALGEFIARAILSNLHRFVVPAVAGPLRLVPIPALATKELSAGALRNAAARGRLQATRGSDGEWRSTRRWVEEYAASRYRRTATDATSGDESN
jgi:Fic/DOC family